MARLRPTFLLPLLAAGCSGQNVEGAWRGPFPLAPGRACELRLGSDRAALLECEGTAAIGAGRYTWDGATLEISLTALTFDGQKARPPEPLRFKVEGAGNSLRAAYEGEVYEWKRRPY